MPYELLHFRDADKILKKKRMAKNVADTLKYVDDVLQGSFYRMTLLKTALTDMGWRENGSRNILDGRKYQFKGFWNRIALEANFSSYEFLQTGLFRLQVGFDKGLLDSGLLLLTAQRSEKSRLGTSAGLVVSEIEALYPTISLPVSIALFDLGRPECIEENEEPRINNVESLPVTQMQEAVEPQTEEMAA
jgi:hypothetical protein